MPTKKAVSYSSEVQNDHLLTPEEAAERLRCSVGTLAVWRSTKRYNLPFVRVGSRIFYKSSSVIAFVESRETTETSHPDQSYRKSRKAVRP